MVECFEYKKPCSYGKDYKHAPGCKYYVPPCTKCQELKKELAAKNDRIIYVEDSCRKTGIRLAELQNEYKDLLESSAKQGVTIIKLQEELAERKGRKCHDETMYWKRRCEAAEKIAGSSKVIGLKMKDYEEWIAIKNEPMPEPT